MHLALMSSVCMFWNGTVICIKMEKLPPLLERNLDFTPVCAAFMHWAWVWVQRTTISSLTPVLGFPWKTWRRNDVYFYIQFETNVWSFAEDIQGRGTENVSIISWPHLNKSSWHFIHPGRLKSWILPQTDEKVQHQWPPESLQDWPDQFKVDQDKPKQLKTKIMGVPTYHEGILLF